MQVVYTALWCLGCVPLFRAWWLHRRTSLLHALNWTLAAWAAWGVSLLIGEPHELGMDARRYVALCVTVAAGVAVLCARFPQAGAWNFVVLGLLAVLLLPLLENHLLRMLSLGPLRILFLGATLAVGLLNYLPTRFFAAVLNLSIACAGELALVFSQSHHVGRFAPIIHSLLLISPWIAFGCKRFRARPVAQFDELWRDFRDERGLFWAQRVREQFNRSAAHAGWPVHLYWQGLALLQTGLPAEDTIDEMIETLKALLKRFQPLE